MTGNLSKDDAAFITNLYSKYHMPVMKVIRLNCFSKHPQDHEDILQDVFMMAVTSINNLKTHTAPYRWLYKTALNLTYNFNRAASNQPETSVESTLNSKAAKTSFINEKSDSKQNCLPPDLLSMLSEEEQKLYILRYKYNFSYKEISDVLHISENNAGVRIYRLNHRIRKIIEKRNEN